jgi:zeaxanthin glucosyltransferase
VSHFAFIAPPLTGHYKPMAALARELVSRGHRATFVHQSSAAVLAARYGADFAPLNCSPLTEHKGVVGTIREVARQTDMLCGHAPDVLREISADVVITDQLEPAGSLIADYLGLPWITVASALPINREVGVPPPYVGWDYDPSPRGQWWNHGGWRITDRLMRPVSAVIQRHSESFNLRPRSRIEDCFSSSLQLAQAVPLVDFPRTELPESFHYLGPFRHPSTEAFDLPGRDGRPLAYCSFGTLQGRRLKLFARVSEACADLGLQLVLAHCGRLTQSQAETLPGNPLVFDYLPQEELLATASLVITHAGFNTVLETLSIGLPMVALPIAFDQPAIGARIRYAGVGEVVSPRKASVLRLRKAMVRVMHEPLFRQQAHNVQQQIAAAGGVRRAAELVEASLS